MPIVYNKELVNLINKLYEKAHIDKTRAIRIKLMKNDEQFIEWDILDE